MILFAHPLRPRTPNSSQGYVCAVAEKHCSRSSWLLLRPSAAADEAPEITARSSTRCSRSDVTGPPPG